MAKGRCAARLVAFDAGDGGSVYPRVVPFPLSLSTPGNRNFATVIGRGYPTCRNQTKAEERFVGLRLSSQRINSISKEHLKIRRSESCDDWLVMDLKSQNGVFINYHRINPMLWYVVKNGDRIDLCDPAGDLGSAVAFIFVVEPEASFDREMLDPDGNILMSSYDLDTLARKISLNIGDKVTDLVSERVADFLGWNFVDATTNLIATIERLENTAAGATNTARSLKRSLARIEKNLELKKSDFKETIPAEDDKPASSKASFASVTTSAPVSNDAEGSKSQRSELKSPTPSSLKAEACSSRPEPQEELASIGDKRKSDDDLSGFQFAGSVGKDDKKSFSASVEQQLASKKRNRKWIDAKTKMDGKRDQQFQAPFKKGKSSAYFDETKTTGETDFERQDEDEEKQEQSEQVPESQLQADDEAKTIGATDSDFEFQSKDEEKHDQSVQVSSTYFGGMFKKTGLF